MKPKHSQLTAAHALRADGSKVSRYSLTQRKCRLRKQPGVVVRACHPSTQEAESEELGVWDQPGLHSKTLSQKLGSRSYSEIKYSFWRTEK